MKKMLSGLLVILFHLSVAQPTKLPNIQAWGVRINVPDMEKAIGFYCDKLGFEIKSKANYPKWVELNTGKPNQILVLTQVSNLIAEGATDCKAGLTLQVNNYDSAVVKLKSKGVDFGKNQKRKEGVGYSIYFEDPFGTRISMMHETARQNPHFKEPKIYNYGIMTPDMEASRFFFKVLGFTERSEKYLPLDMPLGNPDKSFAFMLHYRDGVEAVRYNTSNDEHIVILFKTQNITEILQHLGQNNIQTVQTKLQEGPHGKFISLRDPTGLVYDLFEVN